MLIKSGMSFLVVVVGPYLLSADADPYRGFHMNGMPTASCCGGDDCAPLPDEDVEEVTGGYNVRKWGFVPFAETQPGLDRHFHLCEFQGARRCFLIPGYGT